MQRIKNWFFRYRRRQLLRKLQLSQRPVYWDVA